MDHRADGVRICTAADHAAGGGENPASALHIRLGPASVEVLVLDLDLAPGAIRAGAGLLCAAERQRSERFRSERARRRFIAARAQLRELLAERLHVPPAVIEIANGKHGKPALVHYDLQFNLSHSADVAAYAFAHGCDVGIDIEEIRPVPWADAIAARTFSRAEYDAYISLPPGERSIGFLNCWTRKEAVVKALGEGLSAPLDQFDVSLAPGEPARVLRFGTARGEATGWRLDGMLPAPGYVAAVACRPRTLH